MPKTDPFTAALHEWVGMTMHCSMRSATRYARERSLSISQMGALFYLHRRGSSRVSDLATYLGVTNAAASQMLDRLIDQGVILREENPQDRRRKQITLTEQGRLLIYDSMHERQAWLEELSAHLTAEEKEHIIPALRTLIERVKQAKT